MLCSLRTLNIDLEELLVEFGSQFITPDEKIQPALEIAIIHGHTDIVQYLVSKGAPVNAHDKHKSTALMIACCSEHADIIHILLNHGADPNIQVKEIVLHFTLLAINR